LQKLDNPDAGSFLSILLKESFNSILSLNPFPSTLPVITGEFPYLNAKQESGSIFPRIDLVFSCGDMTGEAVDSLLISIDKFYALSAFPSSLTSSSEPL